MSVLFESKRLTETGVLWLTAASNQIHVHTCQPMQARVQNDRGSRGLLMKGHHSGLAPDCGNDISRLNRSVSSMKTVVQTGSFVSAIRSIFGLKQQRVTQSGCLHQT